MSNSTQTVARATAPKVEAFTWSTLKREYKAAETSGVKARFKAYDAVVRAYALTEETSTDSKTGAVAARSEAERNREVLDSLNIASGNVFSISAIRVGQLVKVYRAIGLSGTDPFTEAGRSVFTQWDAIRKADITSLDGHAANVKAVDANKRGAALNEAVATAKQVEKDRAAANKAAKAAGEPKAVTVTGLSQVVAFAEAALPIVRKVSATVSEADKAEARKALEALLAHLQ